MFVEGQIVTLFRCKTSEHFAGFKFVKVQSEEGALLKWNLRRSLVFLFVWLFVDVFYVFGIYLIYIMNLTMNVFYIQLDAINIDDKLYYFLTI